ncbi:MAG: glycine cleavage system aminomethyltransferase GcvT [Deltaproteobacteria bacterium]|nr:glycine cleavage system aminomethyltransferase GcvT [Deltaproteobacteria bacterium]
MSELKKTPLYEIHKSLGARLVPFAGWEMPVQYSGVMDEHKAVRTKAGIFDVSHMGEIEIKGKEALRFVQKVTSNDASLLSAGQAQYSLICYPHGGIVDDTIVYKFGDERYMLCVNASNVKKDLHWLIEQDKDNFHAVIKDISGNYALIALQGPKAPDILTNLTQTNLSTLKSFHFDFIILNGIKTIVSKTGYTGEDGFEIFVDPDKAAALWEALMEAGGAYGLKPAGLGARDTLRLEMKYTLYGNDIDSTTSPLEANLGWAVKVDKGDFIGREAIVRQKEEGVKRKLICMQVRGKGIPRQGYEVYAEGKTVGIVTSGTMSPSLGIGVAIGYVDRAYATPGTAVDIMVRGKTIESVVVSPPFYKK